MAGYKYFAFISYNNKDQNWGRRVQKKLEHYRMPSTLCSKYGWTRKPMNPIFFAPTDIQPGQLSEELKGRLRASKHLIVICSPNSAKSQWVGMEIAYFCELGRFANIHMFIVDGCPNSNDSRTESYNPILKELNLPELLGANVNERISRFSWINRERAYVQLITKLLNVEFDSIWQRHKRQIRMTFVWLSLLLCLLLVSLWAIRMVSLPVDVSVFVQESSQPSRYLPSMSNAIISMRLESETKTDTICSFDDVGLLRNVPRKCLGKEVQFTIECQDYCPLDTIVVLDKTMLLRLQRDISYYGRVRFTLWDEEKEMAISGCEIEVEGFITKSDDKGFVLLDIPITYQKTSYILKSTDVHISDSIFTMPSGIKRYVLITNNNK